MTSTLQDELLIRQLIERWAIWRDAGDWERFRSVWHPDGYRHLAYIQTRIGYTVKRDMPMLKGPQVEALYAHGARWLAGEAADPMRSA